MPSSKYINPFTDYGFKKLFGEEASKHLLKSFLNDILPIEDKIVDLSFAKNEQQGELMNYRNAVYDINCIDEKERKFVVEMQNASQVYFKDRSVFYSTFPIRDQAKKGNWNFKLNPVYCISLLGFELEDQKHKADYYNEVNLKNQNNEVFYDKLTFVYIELPKFNKKEDELKNHFEKWMYFLKNLDGFDEIPRILNEPIFKDAFEIARVANFTESEMYFYEQSLKVYRDSINKIDYALTEGHEKGFKKGLEKGMEEGIQKGIEVGIQKGMEEGIQKGMEEGIQKGMEEGIQKGMEEGGKRAKLEDAKNFLALGVAVDIISKATGLSIEEINNL